MGVYEISTNYNIHFPLGYISTTLCHIKLNYFPLKFSVEVSYSCYIPHIVKTHPDNFLTQMKPQLYSGMALQNKWYTFHKNPAREKKIEVIIDEMWMRF